MTKAEEMLPCENLNETVTRLPAFPSLQPRKFKVVPFAGDSVIVWLSVIARSLKRKIFVSVPMGGGTREFKDVAACAIVANGLDFEPSPLVSLPVLATYTAVGFGHPQTAHVSSS